MNDRESLIYALFMLATFAVQLAILFATGKRFRPLRFALPILAGAAVVLVPLLCGLTMPGWAILLVPLTIVICLALAGLALVGCGLAWAVYYLIKRKASEAQ